MLETNCYSTHLAGIIPVASPPLDFNMPWADCLMPINENYHAIERAVNTAALSGCSTIWIILHKETQPLIKKKIGEWIYDPETIWKSPNVFFSKVEIPIYYVCVNPRDKFRRDSLAWSSLYGARVSSYISKKMSKWLIPKKFLVISPYGVLNDLIIKNSRETIKSEKNILFTHKGLSFKDNCHLPFTFSQDEFDKCKKYFKLKFEGDERKKTFSEVFDPIDIKEYNSIDTDWYYDISNWENYRIFLGSEHNLLCGRPKYMVTHKWWGFKKNS